MLVQLGLENTGNGYDRPQAGRYNLHTVIETVQEFLPVTVSYVPTKTTTKNLTVLYLKK